MAWRLWFRGERSGIKAAVGFLVQFAWLVHPREELWEFMQKKKCAGRNGKDQRKGGSCGNCIQSHLGLAKDRRRWRGLASRTMSPWRKRARENLRSNCCWVSYRICIKSPDFPQTFLLRRRELINISDLPPWYTHFIRYIGSEYEVMERIDRIILRPPSFPVMPGNVKLLVPEWLAADARLWLDQN